MDHYVLVDCNNFYISCERIFNPKLEDRPVIVLSNNDGCVVARSEEAKKLGIPMGVPFFTIKDLCKQQNIFVYSSNYELYGDISSRIMDVLCSMADDIEIYSIDEAFLQFSSLNQEEIVQHCKEIRNRIKKWIGIPTSLGIAPTKTLAKVASKMAKKDRAIGVFDLSLPHVQEEVLKGFPVEDVWGIGYRHAEKLRGRGIDTAKEFKDQDPILVRQKMGVMGERMLWELRGVSCLPLEESRYSQSITCSRSFGMALTEFSEVAEALSAFVANACEKLREQESLARAFCVFLETKFDHSGHQKCFSMTDSLPFATNDTPEITSAAKKGLQKIFPGKMRYKKCGIILLDLTSEDCFQMDMFAKTPDPKRKRLAKAVDELNHKHGKNSLFYGSMGIDPKWKGKSEKRSQRYTTCWDEIPFVK